MPNARIGFEQFEILPRSDEENLRAGITLLGGIQQHAGDRDIGAQRDSREHIDAAGGIRERVGSAFARRTRGISSG